MKMHSRTVVSAFSDMQGLPLPLESSLNPRIHWGVARAAPLAAVGVVLGVMVGMCVKW